MLWFKIVNFDCARSKVPKMTQIKIKPCFIYVHIVHSQKLEGNSFREKQTCKKNGTHSAMHCGLRFFEMTNVLHLSIVRKIVYLINNPFMPTT